MKNFTQSYKGFVAKEQGNAMMIALVVAAIFGAGFVGYKSGQEDIFEQFMATLSEGGAANVAMKKPDSDAGVDNPVIAKVNGDEIRRQDVVDLVNLMPAQMRQIPLPQLFPMALEQAISNKIVDQKAANAGLEKDKDVQEEVYKAQQRIIRTTFIENILEENVTDEKIKAKYDEYVKDFPEVEEVKAAHILVDSEKEAKDIIAKLGKGESFEELAKEHSQDGSAANGGDLGYFAKNEVVPAFADAAFSAKVGSVVKQPVKSEFGYHIIRVDEKRQRPAAEFAEIEQYLENELQRETFDEVIGEWKAAATVERFDVNGQPIPSEEGAASGEQQAELESNSGAATEPAAGASETEVEVEAEAAPAEASEAEEQAAE